jgi:hypothetical protein
MFLCRAGPASLLLPFLCVTAMWARVISFILLTSTVGAEFGSLRNKPYVTASVHRGYLGARWHVELQAMCDPSKQAGKGLQ